MKLNFCFFCLGWWTFKTHVHHHRRSCSCGWITVKRTRSSVQYFVPGSQYFAEKQFGWGRPVGLKNRQINKTIEPAWLCRKSMRNAQGQRSRSHSHILSMVENRLPSHYRAKHLLKNKIIIWSLFVYSSAVFIAFCKFYDKMSLCVFQHELVSGVIFSDMWHTWTVTARPPPV